VPFAARGTLRESTLVQELAVWMPVGILGILAVAAFRGSVLALPGTTVPALIAVIVNLILGRRTVLSVGIGAAIYVALVNMSLNRTVFDQSDTPFFERHARQQVLSPLLRRQYGIQVRMDGGIKHPFPLDNPRTA
jgi:branched chain amino acid efflux pump